MSHFSEQKLIRIQGLNRSTHRGRLFSGPARKPLACALGKAGQTHLKREGDQKTPIGAWRPLAVLYRPDRSPRPRTCLPISRLQPTAGWCDDSHDRNYNRPVTRPYPASTEALWRSDELYDLIIVLDHNQVPRIKGLGSAIFMHVAKPGYPPTEGCIALAKPDLMKLLPLLTPETVFVL